MNFDIGRDTSAFHLGETAHVGHRSGIAVVRAGSIFGASYGIGQVQECLPFQQYRIGQLAQAIGSAGTVSM